MIASDSIKKSIRIDHIIGNGFIQQLIDTTGGYMKSAIGNSAMGKDMDNYQQFDLAMSLLTQHWYLNRREASNERIPVTVQALVQQMRGTYYADH